MADFTRYDFCGARQAYNRLQVVYDCHVCQKKCRSLLKCVLKRCDNHKSYRRSVVTLYHVPSYHVNRP